MSHGFQITFSPGKASLATTIVAMQTILDEFRYSIDTDIYELEQEGLETSGVVDLVPWSAGSLGEIAVKSQRWFGVGICIVSKDLFDIFGRGTAAEATLEICRRGRTSSTVLYRESASAWAARRHSGKLLELLGKMMLSVANVNGSTYAIYDEETQVIAPTAVKTTIANTLSSGRFPSGGFDGMVLLPEIELFEQQKTRLKLAEVASWRSGDAIAVYLDRLDARA